MVETSLHPDLSKQINDLREALTDVLSDVGADVNRPREMSRKLSLDKNLAWKLSRVVSAEHAQDAIQFVPGDAALDIFIRAVKDAGGATELRRRVEGAIRNFQAAVIRHLGDRPTLDLVVDGLHDENRERLSVARKLLYRGSSGVLGVQAKALLHTIFLAPSSDQPDMLDAIRLCGWIDFRRIRSDARWVMFRRKQYRSNGVLTHEEPVDPACGPEGPRLLKEFCSPSLPEIHSTLEDRSYVDELGKSPVGNSGAFTCFSGSILRKIGSRYISEGDTSATLYSYVSAPVESLQVDMIAHRSCRFVFDQRFATYSSITTGGPAQLKERDILPIHVDKTELMDLKPIMTCPHFARYGDLLAQAFNRMDWNWKDFFAIRYSLQYPPFPSTVVTSFPLEQPRPVEVKERKAVSALSH